MKVRFWKDGNKINLRFESEDPTEEEDLGAAITQAGSLDSFAAVRRAAEVLQRLGYTGTLLLDDPELKEYVLAKQEGART